MIKKISLSVLVACSNHPVKATSYTKKCITTAIVATAFLTKNSQKHAPATMARYRNHHMPPKVHTAHLPYVSFLHRPKPTSHFYNGSTTSSTSKAALPIIAAFGLCTGLGVYAGNHYDTTTLCTWEPWLPVTSWTIVGKPYSETGTLYIRWAKVQIDRMGKGWGQITVAKMADYDKEQKFFVKIKVRERRDHWITIATSRVIKMKTFKSYPILDILFGAPSKFFYFEFEFDVNDVPDHVDSSSDLGVSITEQGTGWW